MRRLQVGVIGLGEIGGAHCASIATLPQAQLVAVADLRADVATKVAGQYGATAYGTTEELLAHPGIEAVIIALPDQLHLAAAVAAAAVIIGGQPLWETPPEHLRTLLDVDVIGVWNTAATCVPHMLAAPDPQGCRFVAVASAAGTQGLFRLAAYNAAKHAVIGIVRGLAADLVGTGVTAVAVSPGSTDTDMLRATADIYGLAHVDEFTSSQLIRRLIAPEEIAATIAFCCSPEGAALNGSVISATGGFGS
jgi:SDR family mycofactocin-dependent oxidoreductase